MRTALFFLVVATSAAAADSRDVNLTRPTASRSVADPGALSVRPASPQSASAQLDSLAGRAQPMRDAAQLPDFGPASPVMPDLAPSRPALPDLAPPAQPSQGVPDLAPPAERMLPGIDAKGERMLPPLTNAGQSFRMIAVDTNASAFVSAR